MPNNPYTLFFTLMILLISLVIIHYNFIYLNNDQPGLD